MFTLQIMFNLETCAALIKIYFLPLMNIKKLNESISSTIGNLIIWILLI